MEHSCGNPAFAPGALINNRESTDLQTVLQRCFVGARVHITEYQPKRAAQRQSNVKTGFFYSVVFSTDDFKFVLPSRRPCCLSRTFSRSGFFGQAVARSLLSPLSRTSRVWIQCESSVVDTVSPDSDKISKAGVAVHSFVAPPPPINDTTLNGNGNGHTSNQNGGSISAAVLDDLEEEALIEDEDALSLSVLEAEGDIEDLEDDEEEDTDDDESGTRRGIFIPKDFHEISGVIKSPKVMIGENEPVPPAIADFRVSEDIVKALSRRGITHFTPIQYETFDLALDGADIIGKSRTGTGKTMAFALPTIEKLKQDSRRTIRGRSPRCVVLAPTRELAKQDAREFELLGKGEIDTACFYGGVSYGPQENAIRKGIDVIVATPGRLIDLHEKGLVDFGEVEIAILDEADEMLRQGFAEDVEKVFGLMPEQKQTLLFSATVPDWVKSMARRYMVKPVTVDTVGTSKLKTAEGVRQLAVSVYAPARADVLSDLISVYAQDRCIIFTHTKKDADDLTVHLQEESQVLHGDIAQYQRELTLQRFRDGKFRVLIATDVAARGLDIPHVDLVVQYQLPWDSETFIHRTGRTGRAGRDGIAIVLCTPDESRGLRQLEKEIGVKFEHVPVPRPEQVIEAKAKGAARRLGEVSPEVLPYFQEIADRLAQDNAGRALAAALALVAGVMKIKKRSLLTSVAGNTAVLIQDDGFPLSHGACKAIIGRIYPEAAGQVGRIELSEDGAICDLPSEIAEQLVAVEHTERLRFSIPEKLPRIIEGDSRPSRGSFRGDRDRGSRGGGRGRFDRGGSRPSRGEWGSSDRDRERYFTPRGDRDRDQGSREPRRERREYGSSSRGREDFGSSRSRDDFGSSRGREDFGSSRSRDDFGSSRSRDEFRPRMGRGGRRSD